jgi:2-polyprenyl-3-methyl-5-hydroxy-6-metoxy-1,4-benzoquinol methylase
MDNLQQIQDDEYSFPYHYVTPFKDGFTAAYFDSWGINYGSTIEFILSKIETENFRSVIDIGCGDGRLTQEIQQRFSSRKVLGIDYSKRAIQLAKSMSPHTEYRQIDITTEALDEQFDLGILMEVFEHVNPEVAAQFVEAVANCLHDKEDIICHSTPLE